MSNRIIKPELIAQRQYPVATNDNRTTSQGAAPRSPLAKTSRIISLVIGAGVTLPLSVTGNTFFLTVCTNELHIRPSGGIFTPHFQGTGLDLDLENSFTMLEVFNPGDAAVTFEIFVGFDRYIDKRLILQSAQMPQVVFDTYPTASAATSVTFTDLSGGAAFQDINNNSWLPIYRVAILVFNTSTGDTYLLQKADTVTGSGPAIAAIFPQTGLNLPIQGDYRIATGSAATVNVIASEIYAAIPA
jgi:hypothetical protein